MAIFQSVGKTFVVSERLIRCVRGVAINSAESFSSPGGRSSEPVVLLRLIDFRWRSTSDFATVWNLKFCSVLLDIFPGVLQTKSHSGVAFSFKVFTIPVKNSQKALEIVKGSHVFTSSPMSKDCEVYFFSIFEGYIDFKIFQNLAWIFRVFSQ